MKRVAGDASRPFTLRLLTHLPAGRDRRPSCSDTISRGLKRRWNGGDTLTETALQPS